MIFKENSLSLDYTNYRARQGSLLISEPFIKDGYFKRTAVFLAIHNEKEGSLGFIINKPIQNIYLSNIVKSLKSSKDWLIFFGGPVQTSSLFYIHSIGNIVEDSKEICDGIYFGGNFDTIQELIKRNEASPQDIKFFLGYSGWGKNQLDEEIYNNSWLTTHANKKIVFGNYSNNRCWQKAVSQTPHFYVAHFPENVMLN